MRILGLLVIGALATLASTSADAQKLYKWVAEDGTIYYSDQVPPEENDKAREELNDQGVVVDSMDRAATEEEIAVRKAAEAEAAALAAIAAEREAQRKVFRDSYHSIDDIERQREQELAILLRDIESAEASIASQQGSLDDLLKRAADQERAGTEASEALNSQIENLRARVAHLEAYIAQKRAASNEVNARYDEIKGEFTALASDGR